jgi:hypothetical protein
MELDELIFPRTDRLVAIQAVAVLVVTAVALLATRRRPDARLLVMGGALVVVAFMGLRTLH